MNNTLIWLVIAAVCVIIEICTLALTTIWFAFGSIAAALVSLATDSVILQCVAFFVVSFALLLLIRPSVVRRFNSRRTKTNVDSVIGKTVVVTEPIDNFGNSGRAKVGDIEWAARSNSDGVTMPVGSKATVVRVEGVKLIVNPKEG